MSKSKRHTGVASVMLAISTLIVVARLAQLTFAPADCAPQRDETVSRSGEVDRPTTRGSEESELQEIDAELALLYMACPASANINLGEVIEQSRAQKRFAAQQVSYEPESQPGGHGDRAAVGGHAAGAVPRIRYPVPVGVRVAARPTPVDSTIASADDWLVDPDDWYSDDDRQRLEQQSAPAESALGSAEEPMDDLPTPNVEAPQSTTGPEIAPQADIAIPRSEAAESVNDVPAENAPIFELPSPQSPPSATPALAPALPSFPTEPPSPTVPFDQPVAPPPIDNGSVFAPPPTAPSPHSPAMPHSSGDTPARLADQSHVDPHLELFARNNYPSARECGKCHTKIYEEWSNSTHAYAMVSPMFHKFEQKINELSRGTLGYFCYRCHSPVGTAMCIERDQPLWELPEVAREGVTCIACHRVQYLYGKNNGERRIEKGDIHAPVLGGIGGDGVAEVVARKDHYKVKTSPDEKGPGQDIHVAGIHFPHLGKAEFCAPCHQVAVHPGIKLEVVWEQYRASPACKKGIRCQDCHMGRIPGVPSGFEYGAAAEVGGKTVNDKRRHSNHNFYGPGYSIAHPGVYPFHKDANLWTIDQWLLFDWRAGWGTERFEDQVANGLIHVNFPPCWKESDDRYDARDIIEDNLKKVAHKREIREQVMENGSHVDGPFFDKTPCRGQDLRFHFLVANTNEGHNLLTASLGAQPQLWANVVLIGPDGRRVWESGYTDSYGDVADIHSVDVRQGRLPFDWQLFNLQTMFLITGAKGTDREFFLPINVDIDQLPFIRPGNIPITTTNHPPFIRMESRSLSPLGSRKVPYRVPAELMRLPGVYRLSFRMRSRAEPIYFMRFVGATVEMQRAMNEGMIDVHPYSTEFLVR